MKTAKLFAMAALATAGVAMMSSCSSDDYHFDPEYAQKSKEALYAQNFEKAFGAIPSNMNWDMAQGSNLSIPGKSSKATRAEGVNYEPTKGDWYNVQTETLNWLKNTLKESTDNRALGKPFAMTVPGNEFSITPIYQGQAGMTWELHMVVGTGDDAVDTKIWTKSQGIQTSKNGNSWTSISTSDNTISAKYVRGQKLDFDLTELAGETMYFYLKILTGSTGWADKGTCQSSLSGMMLNLSCPRPSNIDEEHEVMIIGCEDANLKSSDWDLNDIVFLIEGKPNAPKPIDWTDKEVIETVQKRYMVEDLGSTDDFDFNDVVVDVKQSRTVKYHLANGVIDPSLTETGEWSQTATIKHLGGIYPFTIKIGGEVVVENHYASLGEDGEGTDLNDVYSITGWVPAENNITFTFMTGTNKGVYTIAFPKMGSTPLMIATDPTRNWMKERERINWLKDEMYPEEQPKE